MRAPDSSALARPPSEIRDGVKQALTAGEGFDRLDPDDRREIAHALVRIAHAARLLEDEARDAAPRRPAAHALNAGDEFSGTAVDRMAGATRRMINAISFPRFVNELITGVFRAMVETNQQQLQQYIELVRGVSQSLDGFASLVGDDNMARRWLAERFPQSYQIEEPDPDDVPDPDDEPEPLRLISAGPPPSADALRAALSLEANAEVPSGGGEALVRFVRGALARNRQQMLATMIQMGMQRIVIDSGRIHASMRFHIDASSAAAEDRSSRFDTRHSVAASGSFGIGPWSASASVSSTIGYVSTTDVSTREELNAAADLNSSVELHFRTDQVPLDRIASEQTTERLRLNTLNPERELDIARQADAARLAQRQTLETARAARPRLEGAPAGLTPPTPPPLQSQSGGGRQGAGSAITQPGTASPGTTQPTPTQPAPTQPGTTQPTPTQPAPTQPGTAQPTPTQPAPTQPGTTQPTPTQPAPTQPGTTQPTPTQPAPTQPGTTQPTPTQPAPTQPGTTQPTPTQPSPTQPGTTQPTPTQPAPTQPGTTQPASPNPQPRRPPPPAVRR